MQGLCRGIERHPCNQVRVVHRRCTCPCPPQPSMPCCMQASSVQAAHLLLKCVEDAIDKQLLQTRIDLSCAQVADDLLGSFHDHAPVGLALILQVLHHAGHNLCTAYLQQGRLSYSVPGTTETRSSAQPSSGRKMCLSCWGWGMFPVVAQAAGMLSACWCAPRPSATPQCTCLP